MPQQPDAKVKSDATLAPTVWWVSWEERASPSDTRPLTDPPKEGVLAWWCSGYGGEGDYATMVAMVVGSTPQAVARIIEENWPEVHNRRRVWRFKNILLDRPLVVGDRFPIDKPYTLERLKTLGLEVVTKR